MKKEEEKLDKTFILNSIKKLGRKYGINEAFEDVVKCCAYALANQVEMNQDREKEFIRINEKYDKEEQELFPKILAALALEYCKSFEPIDILGDIYENLGLIKKGVSQFFTPINVCKLLANATINKEKDVQAISEKGYIEVQDPTCGSGRILYAFYSKLLDSGIDESNILLVGDDIDLTCCCMTYIQLSLMNTSAIVHHQNSLTMKIYDTFYTVGYLLNKDLQNKIVKNNTKGDDLEL